MKASEPSSGDNPALDCERRRLGRKRSYKLFVGCVFLLSAGMLVLPILASLPFLSSVFTPSNPNQQIGYSLLSQYNAATATTTSVVLLGNSPAIGFDASTYTLHQIPNASKPALLLGLFGRDNPNNPNANAMQRFYYLELHGHDANGMPQYQVLAAETAWEGDRAWQYVDLALPEKRRKDLATFLADETSRALALAPPAWKINGNPSPNPKGYAPQADASVQISDPFDFRKINMAPSPVSANPMLSFQHIAMPSLSVMNAPFVITNGAQPITSENFNPKKAKSEALTSTVAFVGGLLLWLYYLVSFPIGRTGELENRLFFYTMPQLRVTPLTGREVAEGLLYEPRCYWLWPTCVFVPALLIALGIIWARWGITSGLDFWRTKDSDELNEILGAAGVLADILKWPLAGWLSFAVNARFRGGTIGRHMSLVILAFIYPIVIAFVSFAIELEVLSISSRLYENPPAIITIIIDFPSLLPFVGSLFWLVATGVMAWLLNRGLARRIAAFEMRGE
ncbi:MAG: hypothetical protein NTX50_02290 [Candidatus Sumerlaeota bacterium]|nr:hypothetical protein [Candidatus Sumerlaeota bacterium]